MEEIKLKKLGEPEEKQLPPGIYAIQVGDRIVLVRRVAGRFAQLSTQEQLEIMK